MIVVLDAHDVVLAQIAAGLNLDQLELDFSRIFKAMLGTDRNLDRLVLVDDFNLVADRHPRRAADHDPMLGAMMMGLQRQPAALLDYDALDLEAVAEIDR